MKTYKIVVTGPFNAGKTAFIRTVSDIDMVTTERRISDPQVAATVKPETTVAMDYGQKRLGDALLHLYGTPGQMRFEFMWPILAKEMDAFVLLVDSTDRTSLMDAKQVIRLFRKQAKVPYVVAANKQDRPVALPPAEIRRLLSLSDNIAVMPCVAQDKASVVSVLERVCQLLA
ncbi:MAG TPA: ADP-ribosylation factor-like protein [Anaerolineae bacterium]|nr:ADP-ribosylation factor-like protein [Anaerolineae bacterium]HQI86689.1 ADP-ribosylation factor-like protein [Anaerolineae bacterium]HQK13421.1 ADP-ribosylation factor-like protein [Anaerolineae bacterium]